MKKLALLAFLLLALPSSAGSFGASTLKPVAAVVIVTPHDTYPAALRANPLDNVVDQWGMEDRECTSYAAWMVSSTYHNMPNWFGNPLVPNANNWVQLANQAGFKSGGVPKARSVAIAMPGVDIGSGHVASQYGHSMWVERVNNDGTILVSQYNFRDDGLYSQMTVSSNNLIYIHFGG